MVKDVGITLVGVRNQKWITLMTASLNDDGSLKTDDNGDVILTPKLDDSGNPVKVIECEAQWSHFGDSSQDWLPFTATAEDTMKHGVDLYNALVNGDHGARADE